MTKIKEVLNQTNEHCGWSHKCPGCGSSGWMGSQTIPDRNGYPRWEFNGDRDRPTFSPSVKHDWGDGRVCHYFIRDGRIEFCGDSFHALAGQIVGLPDFIKGAQT